MNKDPFGLLNYKIQAKILVTAFAIVAERALHSFWYLLGWIGLFVCIWLAGYVSLNTSLLFWIGVIVAGMYGVRCFSIPTRDEIFLRVEKASGLLHRPLLSAFDTKLGGSEELWRHEKLRQQKLLTQLKCARPRFNMADRDHYALRTLIILFVICAVILSPHTAWEKISSGAFPPIDFVIGGNAEIATTEIIIDPPAYSGLPSIRLDGSSLSDLGILRGSKIKAQIESSWGHPYLSVGNNTSPMPHKQDTNIWTGEITYNESAAIKINRLGLPFFYQSAHLVEDKPPEISWNGDISVLPTGEMKMPVTIKDDFGIRKLILRGILPVGTAKPVFGSPLRIEKKMNLPVRDTATISPVLDATGHIWAGSNVVLMMEAEDYAGNISETLPREMRLPKRSFTNPVATQINLVRSDILTLNGTAQTLTSGIEDILFRPDLYDWDMMVTLGLRSAATRMEYARDLKTVEETTGILWETAMRMEDGNIADTQNSLKDAISNLQDAIQKGADKAEIARLMQEMQQALIRHLQNVSTQTVRQAMKNGDTMQQTVNGDALQKFLQELQKSLQSGNTTDAMNKLNNLQQLADMLGSASTKGLPKEIKETMQSIEEIQKIIADQKKLLDMTRQLPQKDLPSRAAEQDKIGSATSEMAKKITEQSLQNAQSAMAQSSQALKAADSGQSISSQQKALEELQKSAKSQQQKLQQQMQNVISLGGSSGSRDPLGRNPNDPDEKIDMNGKGGRKKDEAIIKTLREREGDMTRPLEERNYYERLLRQW